jgi:protein phosphatase
VSDTGRERPVNEDCFAIDERLGLCVVADGMGGHADGAVAARLAVDAVVETVAAAAPREPAAVDSRQRRYATVAAGGHGAAAVGDATEADQSPFECGGPLPGDPDEWPFGFDERWSVEANVLRTAVFVASGHIFEAALVDPRRAGMGTTIVAARAAHGRLSVVYAGDSRLYILSNGRLRQVTHDDSWLASMLARNPHADPMLLEHHPMRHALTNVVGATTRTVVHLAEERIAAGDRLLLTSDGVHDVVDLRRLEQLMVEEENPEPAARRIARSALLRGSRDNLTAVVATYMEKAG